MAPTTPHRRLLTSSLARPVRALIAVVAAASIATACSASASTGSTIDEADLEKQVATLISEQQGDGVVPNIDCPGDLDAKVGATTTCDLTVDGDDTVLAANVSITKVDGGVATFDVEVTAG